jgi:hypothetical protein
MLTFDQHLQGALPLDCVDVFYRPGGVAEKPAAIEQRIDPVKDRNAHDCRGQMLHLPLTLKETTQF